MNFIKFDPKKPYRYVRYGRMSSDEQNPRSPDQQFDMIDDTKRRNGLSWVHLRDFRDDAITGRLVRRRPGFWEMLLSIFSGALQPDLILVDTFERFGRAEELGPLRQQLEREYGVLVLTADTNFSDPTSPSGRAMGLLENFRATEDNRIKSHNVRRGKHDAIKQGHWPGGKAPFGLMLEPVCRLVGERQEVDHHKVVHDPRRGWIISLAAQRSYEAGWGDARVTEYLNAHPDIPSEFKPFNSSTIGRRLRNKLYMGVLEYSKSHKAIVNDQFINRRRDPEDVIVVENFCEPLIEPTLFRELERIEPSNRHPKSAENEAGEKRLSLLLRA
jgi:DNA invertase Pin-like site-specific DNA recombinase